MGWRTDSTTGKDISDTQPLTEDEILLRDEEIAWLKQHQRRSWKLINGRIAKSGDPVAAEGTYGALLAYPPAQSLTAVTGGTANVLWWSPATYSPVVANTIMAPEAYRLAATGTITTAAASTLIPSANWGTAVGTGLGSGPTITLGTTITGALWYLIADITIRTGGTAGTVYGMFEFRVGTTAGASTTITQALYGNTVQTVDLVSASTGLAIGGTPSVTTVSVTPTQVHWMSWN